MTADIETWESLVPGAVWYQVSDAFGRVASRQVEGTGSRLSISSQDRILNTEAARGKGPFTDGSLTLVKGGKTLDAAAVEQATGETSDIMLDSQLKGYFSMRQPRLGRLLKEMSDLNLGRLSDLMDDETPRSVEQAVKDELTARQPEALDPEFERIITGR